MAPEPLVMDDDEPMVVDSRVNTMDSGGLWYNFLSPDAEHVGLLGIKGIKSADQLQVIEHMPDDYPRCVTARFYSNYGFIRGSFWWNGRLVAGSRIVPKMEVLFADGGTRAQGAGVEMECPVSWER